MSRKKVVNQNLFPTPESAAGVPSADEIDITADTLAVPHAHGDIELNFLIQGAYTYSLGGRLRYVTAGKLTAFWAATPHRILDPEPGTRQIWVNIPLSWFLQWNFPTKFRNQLLSGDIVQSTQESDAQRDLAMLRGWVRDFKPHDSSFHSIFALEAQARLLRLASACRPLAVTTKGKKLIEPKSSTEKLHHHNHDRIFEAVAQAMGKQLSEPPSVDELSHSLGMHAHSLMRLFKRQTGMTLSQYKARLRVSHAQRLLLSTAKTLEQIAWESGFGSTARFYAAFGAITGTSPRAYRERGG